VETELPFNLTDVDRRIWQEELDEFVPERVFDVHTHVYRWDFNTDPASEVGPLYDQIGRPYPVSDWQQLDRCDAALMPARQLSRLSFGFPFPKGCDFEAANRFAARQVADDPASAALMLVHPTMTDEMVEEQIRNHNFVGFKPYRFYATTGDPVECRISDMLPERQIAVADRHGLIVMLHLPKRDAIADPENLAELSHFTSRYPNVKWILAHCARSYSSWPIERVAKTLQELPHVWYDTSSVCESDAIELLLSVVGADRVMYGSDDIPVGVMRGKYISFGYGWAYLSPDNHSLDLSHCTGQMTFTRYEQLRAMRRACRRLGLTRHQIEDLFCNTATRLVGAVARSVGTP
jgi:amidohydrolase family protein